MLEAQRVTNVKFEKQSSSGDRLDSEEIGISSVIARKIFFNLFFQPIQKFLGYGVRNLKIQINRQAVKSMNDAKRGTAIHNPGAVFRMVVNKIKHVKL